MNWLYRQDDYDVKKDKDVFIDKSIFSVLDVLSRIKRDSLTDYSKGIYAVNPLVKLISTILILILISISRSLVFIIIVDIFLMAAVTQLGKEGIKKLTLSILIIPVFTLIMSVPSILMGNVQNSMILCFKALSSAAAVSLLTNTTKWNHLVKALKLLFIPDIFIFIMELTFRYIYILGEFSVDLMYSLRLKSVGRNNKKYTSLSGIMGVLFLKSKETGDEVNSAMECRGFTGEYTDSYKFDFNPRDIFCCAINVILVILYFFSRGMYPV